MRDFDILLKSNKGRCVIMEEKETGLFTAYLENVPEVIVYGSSVDDCLQQIPIAFLNYSLSIVELHRPYTINGIKFIDW